MSNVRKSSLYFASFSPFLPSSSLLLYLLLSISGDTHLDVEVAIYLAGERLEG